jgi:sialate O-acetylesterase
LKVTGSEEVEVKDILVGDVWLCSGQSNMEWDVNSSDNAPAEIAAANYPKIRLFTVPKKVAVAPTETVDASWEVCSPATVPGFSAVGYFFGRELNRETGIPIGLIDSTWGGTVAEAWTSAEALETMDDFKAAVADVRDQKGGPGNAQARFERSMAAWWKKNDPGSAEQPSWSDPKFDANAWKSMKLPGHWEGQGLPEFDGVVWFRKEFDLPEAWAGKDLELHLGPIDDRDTTFINGTEVGSRDNWLAARDYKVPAGVAKPGRNVIAIRMLDTAGPGGAFGEAKGMKLELAGDAKEKPEPIALAGDWRFKDSTPMGRLSNPPEPPGSSPNRVTVLYNGMIAPLQPFPIQGAIWYQGESNAGRAKQYRKLLPTMIADWRGGFESGDFPFLIVQLANFMAVKKQPAESSWAELREAQFLTTKALPGVGIALAIDIGEANDIHPRNKQEVGRRLALDALATTYGKDIEFSGPIFKTMEVQGKTIKLSFDHVGAGLVAKGGGKLEGFAIAGDDGKFTWAEAVIDGDAIMVSSPEVAKPVKVRYAWADNPICNLYNQAGLPAVPFRTDPSKD